ncbi:MAG: zinc ABC transporter substrate-binding protein [Candidatus Bathyarchaeota archaeon]|nr:zinc ABC transporter substrate-binding protein [Candidatus Termiticorpusculum sp.]
MNQKQKIFLASTILIVIVSFVIITCNAVSPHVSNKLKIVTTFYPLTYLTQQIGGDYVEITQLMPDNVDVHSWEPSVSHILAADDANIIFYNGAGVDHWVEEDIVALLSVDDNRVVVETTFNLTLIGNVEEYGHGVNDVHEHGLYDPHTWVSPYMARMQAEIIYDALVAFDFEHENYYAQRWNSLKQQLEQLDGMYLSELSNVVYNSVFVSHEAYGYLADRYGFEQHGVIGISADQQPSVTTINNMIKDMQKHQVSTIYFDPVYSNEYVQTIKNEIQKQTGQTVIVLKLYLMTGSVDGLDYLEQMQINLVNLKIGLEVN